MKELKRTFIVEIKYPECDTMGNAEDYLQELIEGDLVGDDIGRWCVNVKEIVSNDEKKEDKIKYGETLKDIAKSIDSIIVRQQTKIDELNEEEFKI